MQVITALIGAIVGAIALIAFQELWQKLKERRTQTTRMRSLIGEWRGRWWIGEDTDQPPYVVGDSIRITVADNGTVRGEGRDDKGVYLIEGNLSEHGIASVCYGYRKASLNGVAILQPSPAADEYAGYWHGYTKEGVIVGGIVTWKRVDG
jgi:hypothetical protein